MRSATASSFEEAAKRERELNERQRQVLDLLVKGRTNGEIATELGITLDGAKWNVSEILGKLGLASREEAAGYWRWRKRPGRRLAHALRGLAALPAMKLAAGGAAAVVAVGAAVALWFALAGGGGERTGEGAGREPFYLEARIEIRSNTAFGMAPGYKGTVPPPIQPATLSGERIDLRRTSVLRWWYEDNDHMRWEIDTVEPALDAKTLTVVDDGKYEWAYDSLSNTFVRKDLIQLPANMVRSMLMGTLLGPAPAETADRLMSAIREWGNGTTTVTVIGEETLLGRTVTVIEYEPLTRSSDSSGKETGSGVGRMWLDESAMMVLKSTGSGSQEYVAEVTKLEVGKAIPKDKLSFSPPKGATEEPGTGHFSGSASGGAISAAGDVSSPAGFLTVPHPDGWLLDKSGTQDDGGGAIAFDVSYTSGPSYYWVRQRNRPDGLPPALKSGQPRTFDAITGYEPASNGANLLAFERDGISVTIASNGLTFEELEQMASQMTLAH